MLLLVSTAKLFVSGSGNLGMAGYRSGVVCVDVRDRSLLQDYIVIIKAVGAQ